MSVAFYIVLDNEEPGFETFVNGKSIAKETKKLDKISKKLGVPTFDDFNTMSADDIGDLLGEEIDIPGHEEKWFSADEGLSFVAALKKHINENPKDVKDAKGVLEDLDEYEDVLKKAKGIGAKWHLNLDI